VPARPRIQCAVLRRGRLDGTSGELIDGPAPEAKKVKAVRTHWDMLMERRTIADLEEVLAERLDVLRARRGAKSA